MSEFQQNEWSISEFLKHIVLFLTLARNLDFIKEFTFYSLHDWKKSKSKCTQLCKYSRFECFENIFLKICSELVWCSLIDLVICYWKKSYFSSIIFLKGENLKFMLVIWESILRKQLEFKTFFFFSSSNVSNDGWLGRRWRLGKCRWAWRWWFWQVIMKLVVSLYYQDCG